MPPVSTENRNSSVEFLRIFFMLLIVLGHIYVHGTNIDYQQIYQWGQTEHFFHTALFSLCKIGVTGFMFISGYYGIRFSFKKILMLFFTALFYHLCLGMFDGVKQVFQPYRYWWYFNSYIFIYAISPLIEHCFENLNEKKLRMIVILALFYTYVGKFVAGENSHNTEFLLTVYVVAKYLSKYQENIFQCFRKALLKKINLNFVIGAFFVIAFFLPIIESQMNLDVIFFRMTTSNNNLFYLVFSWLLVYYADKHKKKNKVVNMIAQPVFGVYLISDYPTVRDAIIPFLYSKLFEQFLVGFAYLLAIFVACLVIEKIRSIIFKKVFALFF